MLPCEGVQSPTGNDEIDRTAFLHCGSWVSTALEDVNGVFVLSQVNAKKASDQTAADYGHLIGSWNFIIKKVSRIFQRIGVITTN